MAGIFRRRTPCVALLLLATLSVTGINLLSYDHDSEEVAGNAPPPLLAQRAVIEPASLERVLQRNSTQQQQQKQKKQQHQQQRRISRDIGHESYSGGHGYIDWDPAPLPPEWWTMDKLRLAQHQNQQRSASQRAAESISHRCAASTTKLYMPDVSCHLAVRHSRLLLFFLIALSHTLARSCARGRSLGT